LTLNDAACKRFKPKNKKPTQNAKNKKEAKKKVAHHSGNHKKNLT
jgi:hypothetical protein